VIVREDGGGADEDPLGQRGGLVDERVILNLAARPHDDALADVCAAPNDGLLADERILAHLSQMPHARAGGNLRAGCNVGAGLDHGIPLM